MAETCLSAEETRVAKNLSENKATMLKKENRLKKHYQYNYVYKYGTKIHGKAVSLHICSSKTKNIKVGLTVTKKIGKATKRNLARRRLREIIRKKIDLLKQNFNLIIVAHDNILNFSFKELDSEIFALLKKAKLFEENEKIS